MSRNAPPMPDRNELASAGMRLVRWLARDFKHLPAGLDVEELESIGGEAVAAALEVYDPASGLSFVTHCRAAVKNAMQRAVRCARTAARRRVVAFVSNEEPDMNQAPDRLAADPADLAAERCDPKPVAASPTVAAKVATELTDPKAVARRAAELRAEVFAGIKNGDMTAVMQSMVRGAKQGDPRCARLLLDVLGVGQAVE